MHFGDVTSTDLFVGSPQRPLQVVRVTLVNQGPGRVTAAGGPEGTVRVRVDGTGVTTPEPVAVSGLREGDERVVEVPVALDDAVGEGSARRVTVTAETATGVARATGEVTAAATGWTMFMVSHFHYDPVWWNTQRGFTQVWYDVPAAEERRPGFVRTAFDLVRLHLAAAGGDPDYKFVLAELDYLKPFWDAYPEERAVLRRLIDEGRVELLGGTYNEPCTTLTVPESTVRNAVYGIGFQRDVAGADPQTAWMLDVFGHDPSFPGLMADAGLTSSSWARGPFHQNGPFAPPLRPELVQFPMEFEWVSPSGRGLLTSYMANHYGPGWELERHSTLADALDESYRQFQVLKGLAATRAVLLPVGGDHTVPSRWCTEVHREWARRYVWPRFVVGTPREFFTAVRAELDGGADGPRRRLTPQSRDMGPVYTGKDVSYIDTKQAQRAAEVAVMDGERLATLAALHGARFPGEALDKAWRQLLFGAHHDAVTGVASDQVYLDLLAGWREAYELGDTVRAAAIDHLATRIDPAPVSPAADATPSGNPGHGGPTSGDPAVEGAAAEDSTAEAPTARSSGAERAAAEDTAAGWPVLVVNTVSWPRDGVARVTLTLPEGGATGLTLRDDRGAVVPAMTEGVVRHPDGSVAEVTLALLARDVPALGYRTYRAAPSTTLPAGWVPDSSGGTPRTPPPQAARPAVVENDTFLVEADPARGGALTRILDKRCGKELLRPGGVGNELVCYEEYSGHPRWTEGPWHVLPKGPGRSSSGVGADVRVERGPLGSRLVATWSMAARRRQAPRSNQELRVTQETILWDGVDRIDFRTHVDGSIGQDRLLRARFALDIAGGLPLHEVGNAVIGRSFGYPDADTAVHPWTMDNAVHTWVGLGSTARVALHDPEPGGATAEGAAAGRPRAATAIGVAEVVAPQADADGRMGDAVRDLVARLAAQGVTATTTRPDGPRHGLLEADSNLPDVRIVLGGPDDNAFAAQVLEAADPAYATWLEKTAAADGHGRAWVPPAAARNQTWIPGADVRGARALPALIIAGDDLAGAVAALADDLADATVEVRQPADLDGHTTALEDYSAAVLHRGTPGCVVTADGDVSLSLMRSCTGWPAGTWLDGPRRTAPDGSSFALQHWSHTFEYALAAGAGDWREAGFVAAGQEFNHTLLARAVRRAIWRGPAAGATTGVAALPPEASLLRVEPASVVLAALKPRGNPLASGRDGQADPRDGVTVRVYEAAGQPTRVTVRSREGFTDAAVTDLLEERQRRAAQVQQGAITFEADPAETATITARPAGGTTKAHTGTRTEARTEAPGSRGPRPALGPSTEAAQPVFSRYWLHDKGAAPLGNVPVSVHVRPVRLALDPEGAAQPDGTPQPDGEARGRAAPPEQLADAAMADTVRAGDAVAGTGPRAAPRQARLRVTVAAGGIAAAGRVELVAPVALEVAAAAGCAYDLSPGEHAAIDLGVAARPGTPSGVYHLAARITDQLGQAYEDVCEVVVGGQAGAADPADATAPLRVTLTSRSGIKLAPGAQDAIRAQVTNTTRSEIRGEAQLVSPVGTWDAVTAWATGFTVAPGATVPLAFPVRVPAAARAGAQAWALVKAMAFGHVAYTEAVTVEVVA